MPSQPRGRFVLLKALVAAVILSTAALLNFYAANMSALAHPARVLQYAAGILAAAAILAAMLALLLRKIPLWRIVLATGLMIFVFFTYRVGLIEYEVKGRFGESAPIVWTLVSVGTGVLALILIRRPAIVTVALVVAAAFAALPVARIAMSLASEHRAPRMVSGAGEPAQKFAVSPNIYWIVLDGYPRQDVLKEDFSFDNSGFIQSLGALDFTVLSKSRSNFPATINSISSTVSADYTVEGEGERLKPFAMEQMYPMVRGTNRTVSRLKAAGYSYVHFQNGYDSLTACASDAPRCVRGNFGLDEMDVAILSNTPIIDFILQRQQSMPFAWGGVNDLTFQLTAVQSTPSPFFLYAHVLVPHPPIRFTAECGFRPADPDLGRWIAANRPAFLDQLRCTNAQTLTLLGKIVESDPGALIILQSDHGTAFRGQTKRSPAEWSDADLHERFGVLNAMRLPKPCRALPADDITLVDTFPLVFACLTGGAFEPRHPRFFVTPYDDMPDFGQAVEFPDGRVK